jgi:hypothetical protein
MSNPVGEGNPINTRMVSDRDGPGQEDNLLTQVTAEIIRSRSKAGRLVSREEIGQELLDRQLLSEEGDETPNLCEGIIERALEENEDLIKLQAEGAEPHFFSSRYMSEAYAGILVQKRSDPVLLIAEVVRQNSAIYPRPVPVGAFEHSPFDLTNEEIQSCLNRMAGQDEFQDIKQTSSSVGTLFLYSTLHLEPGYASMLAEWLDVGQANNP